AVKDDAIREVAEALNLDNQLIVHTSGSVGLDVLEGISAKTGVFYPLQTFSQNIAIDFRTIPIAIEGSSAEVTATIRAMADRLSERVIELDSVKRRTLHIAAVFSCNFTNHLYALSQQILNTEDLSFDLLRPLIAEASAKIQMNDPVAVQTGPAVRGDNNTLARHLEILKSNTKLAELYQMLSESIVNINKHS
ncbi:MAG: DUF2520 domain-containing protein, partial [Daejeonella sp.]